MKDIIRTFEKREAKRIYDATKAFNNNASNLIIERGLIQEFLEHIGLKPIPSDGKQTMFECPCCSKEAYIWIGKKSTPLGWNCPGGCHDNEKYKNIIALCKVATGKKFGEIYKLIAGFLDYDDPFEITNMNEKTV